MCGGAFDVFNASCMPSRPFAALPYVACMRGSCSLMLWVHWGHNTASQRVAYNSSQLLRVQQQAAGRSRTCCTTVAALPDVAVSSTDPSWDPPVYPSTVPDKDRFPACPLSVA